MFNLFKLLRLFSFVFLFFSSGLVAQNTVGIITNNAEKVFPGYNLLYPHNQPNVYLLDNCGQVVHTWTDDAAQRPGNTAYLTPDGRLVKTKRLNSSINDPIWAGGGGAVVEVLTWDNQVLYSFELNDSLFRLHHDIAVMPNGHVLMIAWENKSYEEAVKAGRDTSLLPGGELWSEMILEWDPVLDSVVWEWHVWDHLIQDYDARSSNFGVVADHPELIDLNYDEHDGHPDWLHMNAIDYHPGLDQIVVSVPYFNELWIIDHSTTREEAAGHTGGNSGKGGDLLYRWGNPATYDQGTAADQKLFFNHGVHWADPLAVKGAENYGAIVLFNNRVTSALSSANLLDPGFNEEEKDYEMNGPVFGPADFRRTATHPGGNPKGSSSSLSSAQLLPNGNLLVLSGRWGYAYELTPANEVVWEFIVPLKEGAPATQGDSLAIVQNLTFRYDRYPEDFGAFQGKDLAPIGHIELDPNQGFCGLTVSAEDLSLDYSTLRVYPNPSSGELSIDAGDTGLRTIWLYDLTGRIARTIDLQGSRTTINIGDLAPGLYFLRGPDFVKKLIVNR